MHIPLRSQQSKFDWLNFWEYFNIRDIAETQGDYQRRLNDAFSQLETDALRVRLLNLLDLQLVIQLELIYANNEHWEAQLEKAAPIRCHTSKSFELKDPLKPTREEIDAFFAPDPNDSGAKEKALLDEIESKISYRYDTLHARLQLNDNMRHQYSLPSRVTRMAELLNMYLENGSTKKLSSSMPNSID